MRHSFFKQILFLVVALTVTTATGFAQQANTKTEAKPAPTKVADSVPDKDVENLTCGDLLFIFGDDTKIQDSTYLVIWAYGFKTGLERGDLSKNPLTPAGLKQFVGEVYDLCKVDSDAKFVNVLRNAANAGK